MKKSIKTLLSAIIALAVLLTIPVIAFAEDSTFDFKSASVKVISGSWKDDKADRVQVIIVGAGRKLVTDGVILTVGTNEEADNICSVTLADATVNFAGEKTTIEFNLNQNIDHEQVYSFLIPEGAFASSTNAQNNAYKHDVTGNVILETMNVTPYDVPNNPIYKFINYLEGLKYSFLFYPIIIVLKFFVGL